MRWQSSDSLVWLLRTTMLASIAVYMARPLFNADIGFDSLSLGRHDDDIYLELSHALQLIHAMAAYFHEFWNLLRLPYVT